MQSSKIHSNLEPDYMTEESLLSLIRQELPTEAPSVIVGSGDDCAVVKLEQKNLVLKTDATIEKIHFTKKENLSDVGWKALCRAISDFAAMGATPQYALITVAAPASFEEEHWLQLCRGFGKAARSFNITIVGGEIARSPGPLFLSVALTGITGTHIKLRSSARPGDLICVTGQLGGSLKSGRHLNFIPRLAEGQWLAARREVHAMMDLSDGLGSDLPRLAHASNCSFTLAKEKIPCHPGCTIEQAISDGEDYELLFTLDCDGWSYFDAAWKEQFPNLALTRIGVMTTEDKLSTLMLSGFDHLIRAF